MRPPLLERLGWAGPSHTVADERGDRAVMARSLMYLFFAGGAVTLMSLLLPYSHDAEQIAITGASAFGMAFLLLLAYDRIPVWGFQVFLAAGTVLVEWAIYSSGDTTSPYAMFYFWIAIYAFYFLGRFRASLQMAFIAIAYSAVLLSTSDVHTAPVIHWLFVTSTLV